MAITIHAACPVCHETVVYEHEGDGWGSVSAWDYGIVEITAHDGGAIAEHKNSHSIEEWGAVQKRHAEGYSKRVERFVA